MMTASRKKKLCLILAGIAAAAVLLCGLFFLVLTPLMLRDVWLPAAARSAGVRAKADKLSLVSLIPFRVNAVNFHYTSPDISLDIGQITTGLSLARLKKHQLDLHDAKIAGLRLRRSLPPVKSSPDSDEKNGPPSDPHPSDPWLFSIRGFELKNGVFEYENQEKKVVRVWTVNSLRGNRFLPDEVCSITADSTLRVYPDKRNPAEIRALPFLLKADYRVDQALRLKSFTMDLKTGICDFAIPEMVTVPHQAGIRAEVRAEGSFPDPETFRIVRSETQLFKGSTVIGKLQCKGETGRSFQYDGVLSGLDLKPYLSLFAPDSKVSLHLSRAEFAVTGSDFSPEGVRRDLKARIIARLDRFSLPVELNRNSRLMRLIMIPIEVLPTFLEMATLKWNLRKELVQCANSIRSVISGRQNLEFDDAELDFSLEAGILNIRNFTLHGKNIKMESIRGTLDFSSEKMDIRAVLLVSDFHVPMHFRGTLSKPAPHLKKAMEEFFLLNAPLLKRLESLLSDPPSQKDSRLEKAVKRGYRNLQRRYMQ